MTTDATILSSYTKPTTIIDDTPNHAKNVQEILDGQKLSPTDQLAEYKKVFNKVSSYSNIKRGFSVFNGATMTGPIGSTFKYENDKALADLLALREDIETILNNIGKTKVPDVFNKTYDDAKIIYPKNWYKRIKATDVSKIKGDLLKGKTLKYDNTLLFDTGTKAYTLKQKFIALTNSGVTDTPTNQDDIKLIFQSLTDTITEIFTAMSPPGYIENLGKTVNKTYTDVNELWKDLAVKAGPFAP